MKTKISSTTIALASVLALAFILRTWGSDFGRPFQFHPDEVKHVEPALQIAFEGKNRILAGDWSVLNPKFFFYPYFLTYLLAGVIKIFQFGYQAARLVAPLKPFTALAKADFYLLAHTVTALFGTATVYVTYLIGKLLNSKRMGLLAAFILSVMFLSTKDSHYFTGDIPATFFIITSLYFLLKSVPVETQDFASLQKNYLLSSLFLGLGVACKYYPIILLPILIVGFSIGQIRRIRPIKETIWRLLKVGVATTAVCLGVFVATNPFTLLDYPTFSAQMAESSARSRWGNVGYSHPNPLHYIYNQDHSFFEPFFVQNNLVNQVGPFLLAAFVLGAVISLSKKEKKYWWLLAFAAVHTLFFARYKTHIIRWLIPLTPIVAILAAYTVAQAEKRFKLPALSLIALVLLFTLPTTYATLQFNYILTQKDTRSQAYDWILENIPDGAVVLTEYFSITDLYYKNNQFYSLNHLRYDVDSVFANSRAPSWEEVKADIQPDYVVLNNQHREKYTTPGSRYYWPEATASWNKFYQDLENEAMEMVSFVPSETNFRPGPEMRVYRVEYKEGKKVSPKGKPPASIVPVVTGNQ